MPLSVATSSIRQSQHPLVRQLAEGIEAGWQQLALSPYYLPEELGYVEGKLEGEKLIIENRCYQTPQFRKMHLELAKIGKNLDILHCVMFPRPEYELPIFGCDIVSGRGQISAAIVDLSAATAAGDLTTEYTRQLSQLAQTNYSQPRDLPEWGKRIFSEFCCFVKPTTPAEEQQFLAQAKAYLSIHIQTALSKLPTPERRADLIARQRYYCQQQQQNDKTRRVLEKAFDPQWAERYMTTVLFDLPEA
ncbi:phycocyanobilin:ferredoxin oxidoreductase [cf. Phormidesmis sp. LEGE 11477]|uniref:phycocyanobilin:ferredoxin oxidoreductase n=1 Tax=cf. Phormidesmis sp. LEGE 11477 TaxID=1828680 RepID=UPI0018800ACE|nr:phycocyanobilin:ferredoxin oxidoreductase [cf. Phormidesmis sp. LEGE 11477]MBE9061288.1 phycocyanobilin:ferredoxin oxidoreductase [cf. Phormidesmis sp. LEGE 11477]